MMYSSEEILGEIFEQLPPAMAGELEYPVRYEWGSQKDLLLYMRTVDANPTPLVWLVQGDSEQPQDIGYNEVNRRIRLIIAKSSEHKTNRNPTVWRSEFKDVLNPILENVRKCLGQSGKTMILSGTESIKREANYSEYAPSDEKETYVIDHWNVIIYEAEIKLFNFNNCIQPINFI